MSAHAVADPRVGDDRLADAAGFFGPGSISWRIDRELLVLAGGSCALLMQAAHPSVAAGVAEHSTYATDPFGRLLRTLTSSFDLYVRGREPKLEDVLQIHIHAGELHVEAKLAMKHLVAAGVPFFQRGGRLMRSVMEEGKDADG